MKQLISKLQPMGRALMLPIAVLPVAALLLRLGQPDLLNVPAIAAAGDAVFSNLGLLFAIGVAVGLARENHGAAGLAAVVGYLVATHAAKVLIGVPPDATAEFAGRAAELAAAAFRDKELAKLSVPLGLLSGLIAGWAYNRFGDLRLPSYLAFFGGRRFVPIVCGLAGLVLGLCFGVAWPVVERGMDAMSQAVLGSESIGLFAYGVLNRVLIVTGLHHIINNIAWFLLGDYNGVTGDLKRFFAGDPAAGAFMSGFFPVMMFGLPGACLAMYRTARADKRKAVGGMLFSMALTSFLTGVTEPIEFSFMFLAPLLYGIHALLTGIAMALMHMLGVHLGFGFSAGLFDYVLNFSQSTRPWALLPVGALYFGVYYGLFRFFILRFDLKTLGREADEITPAGHTQITDATPALAWIRALGSAANLRAVEACTTRLRLVVADAARLDEPAIKSLGARGVLRLADGAVQVVVGPIADQLASEIRQALREAPVVAAQTTHGDIAALTRAFGGAINLASIEVFSTRLRLTLKDAAAVDATAVRAAGFRGAVQVAPATWHVIVGPVAENAALALRAKMTV
jgi:PTS system N-acetylglucosamine-specific IIC component